MSRTSSVIGLSASSTSFHNVVADTLRFTVIAMGFLQVARRRRVIGSEGTCKLVDRLKPDLKYDPALLQADLKRLESVDWIEHLVKQNYDGDWSVIPLRGPATATHPVMMIYSDPTCSEFADMPFLDDCPYFRSVLESFSCPLQAVRLMKLSPGSRIKEHTDHDLAAESGTARLHIPIVTSSQVDFWLNGTRILMNEGECWYLRLCDPHSVENNGDSDRVHLVIDAEVNGWLRTQLDPLNPA